jgi:hypothetical protein
MAAQKAALSTRLKGALQIGFTLNAAARIEGVLKFAPSQDVTRVMSQCHSPNLKIDQRTLRSVILLNARRVWTPIGLGELTLLPNSEAYL